MQEQQYVCPICLVEIELQDAAMTNCTASHVFHKQCLFNLCQKGFKKCPIDKIQFNRYICNGVAKSTPQPVPQQKRCFLCNVQFGDQKNQLLECNSCKFLRCHKICLQKQINRKLKGHQFVKELLCSACEYTQILMPAMEYRHMLYLKRNAIQTLKETKRLEKQLKSKKKQLKRLATVLRKYEQQSQVQMDIQYLESISQEEDE